MKIVFNDKSELSIDNRIADTTDIIVSIDNYDSIAKILKMFSDENLKHVEFIAEKKDLDPLYPDQTVEDISAKFDNLVIGYVNVEAKSPMRIHISLQTLSIEDVLREEIEELKKKTVTPEQLEQIEIGKILMGEEE